MANTPHRQPLFQTPHFPSAPDAPPHLQPIRPFTSTTAIEPMAPAENVIPHASPAVITSPSPHQTVQVQTVSRAMSNQRVHPMSQLVSRTASPSAPSHIASSDVNATTPSSQPHRSAVDTPSSVSFNQPPQPSSVVDGTQVPIRNHVEAIRHTTHNVSPSPSSQPSSRVVSSIAKQVGSQLQIAKQRKLNPIPKQQLLSQSSPLVATAQSFSNRPASATVGPASTRPPVPSSKKTVKPGMMQMALDTSRDAPSTHRTIRSVNEVKAGTQEVDSSRIKRQKLAHTESTAKPAETNDILKDKSATAPAKATVQRLTAATSKLSTNSKPSSEAQVSSSGALLPMLRSSPVEVARSPTDVGRSKQQTPHVSMLVSKKVEDVLSRNSPTASVGSNNADEKEASETMVKEKESSPKPDKKRKRRKISWAAPEKLEEVHYIDTRAELIKSWDPDFQVTLPFAQTTLQMFQAAQQAEVSAQNGSAGDDKGAKGGIQIRSKPKLSTFEEARKREHEMELERARRAREEQKRRLDSMCPKRPWRRPLAIVLPAECRKDPAEIEDYNIVDEEQPPFMNFDDPNRASPQSPVLGSRGSRGSRFTEVPVIPLSDGSTRDEGNGSSQSPPYTSQQDAQEYYGAPNSNSYRGNRGPVNYDTHMSLASSGNHTFGSRNIGTEGDDRHAQANYREGTKETNNYHNPILGVNPEGVQHILAVLKESGVLKPKPSSSNQIPGGRQDPGFEQQANDNRHAYHVQNEAQSRDTRSAETPVYDANNDRHNANVSLNRSPSHPSAQAEPPHVRNHGPQMKPPSFVPGMQHPGPMEGMPFPIPPLHPPHLGMLPIGFGLPLPMGMPPMGMPLPMHPGAMPMNGPGQDMGMTNIPNRRVPLNNGRVDGLMRPKQKPLKQRKRCKYFGTKQGCRDGNACMFAHN